jgi:hypothetical protein
MNKSELTLDHLIKVSNVDNRAENRSQKTVGWYNAVLGRFQA